MTAISAFLLAVIVGWMVPGRRLAMAAFAGPWLAALIYQTVDIGLGYAVSPPQTVTQFPRVIGYIVVTAVILAAGLTLTALLADWRSRRIGHRDRPEREVVVRGVVAGTLVVAGLTVLDIADHAILVWPESIAHHTVNPSPPLFGILSIALCLAGIVTLGVARRRAAGRPGGHVRGTAGHA